MKVTINPFGSYQNKNVDEIILNNGATELALSNFGARLLRWINSEGKNIVLGFNQLEDYITHRGYYYGATIGPVGGRISGAIFELEGEYIKLDANEGDSHLHGGEFGYDFQVWDYKVIEREDAISIIFTLKISDKESVYPGNIQLKVVHTYDINNQWTIEYEAVSDQATILNLTNHVYFNLNGNLQETVKNHQLSGNISHFLPVKADGTPTGEICPVEGTPFDLGQTQLIGDILTNSHPQIQLKSGYDHPFVFDSESNQQLKLTNGAITVEMKTDQVAVVIYVHSFAERDVVVNGENLVPYAGVALEAQALPDAPNHDNFGSIQLAAGETYHALTSYRLMEA